jgi:hypothetical protein
MGIISPLLWEHAIFIRKKLRVWYANTSIGLVFHHFFPKTIIRFAQHHHIDFMVCKNGTIFVGESNCSAVHPEALDQIRAQMRVLVSVACGIHVIHSSQLAHWLAPLLIAR